MNPKLKKGIIICILCACGAGGIFGIRTYLNSKNTIDVESVASLNIGYMDDPMSSTGMVSDSDSQSVSYDSTKTITNVYVTQGQNVKAGDPLLSYDLTSLNLAVEADQIAVEKAKNDLALAQYQLQQLKNTTPDPSPTPTPSQTPEPIPSYEPVPEVPAKDENGHYPYVVSMAQANTVAHYCVSKKGSSAPDKNDSGWTTSKPELNTETDQGWYWIEDLHNPDAFEAKEWDGTDVIGTKTTPYVFELSEDGYVYGALLNHLDSADAYLQFIVYDEEEPVTAWTIKASRFTSKVECRDTDSFDILTLQKNEHIITTEETSSTNNIDYSGYTAAELAKAIRDKQQEILTDDLNLRKAQLTLSDDQALLNDGIVYAKRDGVVRKVSDIENPPTDGTAFLEVASGTGLSISGTISELMLEQIKEGDVINAYSWNSGESYSASIVSIDDYPSEDGYYSGSGNPNVSYYGFTAYIEDSTGLNVGDYLDLQFPSTSESSSIWLSTAYVRKEGNQRYVLKDDGNGKLVKQYVETGPIMYGEYIEIVSGITYMDYLAFPYSKNAVEGTKTKSASADSDSYAEEEVSYD